MHNNTTPDELTPTTTSTSSAAAPRPVDPDLEDKLHLIAEAALDRKAQDLLVLDVRGLVTYTDYLIVCSGTNDRQVRAIANNVQAEMAEIGYRPLGLEGKSQANWVVIDYGDYVVHIFHVDARETYSLDKLWNDARRLPIPAAQDA
ncbi:MAG: ribosome silencing factor [Myxococcota bacterium]